MIRIVVKSGRKRTTSLTLYPTPYRIDCVGMHRPLSSCISEKFRCGYSGKTCTGLPPPLPDP